MVKLIMMERRELPSELFLPIGSLVILSRVLTMLPQLVERLVPEAEDGPQNPRGQPLPNQNLQRTLRQQLLGGEELLLQGDQLRQE